jgi:hypothetical protein
VEDGPFSLTIDLWGLERLILSYVGLFGVFLALLGALAICPNMPESLQLPAVLIGPNKQNVSTKALFWAHFGLFVPILA